MHRAAKSKERYIVGLLAVGQGQKLFCQVCYLAALLRKAGKIKV